MKNESKLKWWKELTNEQQRKVAKRFWGDTAHHDYHHHGYLESKDGLRFWEWVQGPDFGKLTLI